MNTGLKLSEEAKKRSKYEQNIYSRGSFPTVTKQQLCSAINLDLNTLPRRIGEPWFLGTNFDAPFAQAEDFAIGCVKSSDLLFTPVKGRSGALLRYESKLLPNISLLPHFLILRSPDIRWGEFSELLFEVAQEVGVLYEIQIPGMVCARALDPKVFRCLICDTFDNPRHPSHVSNMNQADCLNDMSLRLGKAGKQKIFTNRASKRRENAVSNLQSSRSLISALYVKHPRLLVGSLQLGYMPHCLRVSDSEAQRDLQHLRNNHRGNPGLFGTLVGVIWHLERGIWSNGPHFQVWLFFDAAQSIQADIINQIGNYWVQTVTGGRGMFSNCENDMRPGRQLGLGCIEQTDFSRRTDLDKALQLLTLRAEWAKPVTTGRLFGTSRA